MKAFVFTHNDLDGVGAAIVIKNCLSAQINDLDVLVQYHTYESIDSALQKLFSDGEDHTKDMLFITDICPLEESCNLIDKNKSKFQYVRLLDHHKTRSWVQKYSWAKYHQDACGAVLALAEFSVISKLSVGDAVQALDEFVLSVHAWDSWLLNSKHRPRGEDLNTLVGFLGRECFFDTFCKNPNADKTEKLSYIVTIINQRKNRYVTQVIKDQLNSARLHLDACSCRFKILFATDFISEVAHAALEHPDGVDLDYVCVINPTSDSCSLRSRSMEKVDVSKIAKALHGGGHNNAAGFPFKMTSMIGQNVFKLINSTEY